MSWTLFAQLVIFFILLMFAYVIIYETVKKKEDRDKTD